MSTAQYGAARLPEGAKEPSQIPEDLFFHNIVASYVEAPRFLQRDWLAQELQSRLDEPGCRFVLLTGEPGVGKSAFIAQLAASNHDWPVYFIRRDQRRSLGEVGAKALLLRIGFEMAALFPEAFDLEQIRLDVEQDVGTSGTGTEVIGARIGKIRTSPFQQTAVRITQRVQQNQGRLVGLVVDEWLADPRLLETEDLHELALFRPARNLLRLRPNLRVTILVDALDELRYRTIDNDILSWLTNCPPLPENIRFVLTSRPEQDALRTFADKQGDSVRTLRLDAADPRVRDELAVYAAGLATIPEVSSALARTGRSADEFAEQCALKADGNIGYLATLARAMDQQRGAPEGEGLLDELVALKQLPSDLDGLYAFFLGQIMSRQTKRDITVTDPLTRRRGLINAWTDLYHPLLSVLAVALQPLTVDQLQALSGTLAEREQVSQAVEWLSQFLDQIGTEYRLFHATVAEFLTSGKTRTNPQWSALYVNSEQQHRAIATEIGRDDGVAIWREDSDPTVQGRRSYARSFYISHLYFGRDWQRLFEVIEAGAYGRGKVISDPSMLTYALDLDLAIEAAEGIPALGALWRFKLLRSTMAGYADALPPDSYAALATVGRASEALRLVELVVDPGRQVAAFAALGRSLPLDPVAQRCLLRSFEVLALLAPKDRGRVAEGLLNAARVVREAVGKLTPEVQQALHKSAELLVQEAGGGDLARSAAVLLRSVGADDKVQALLNAMWSHGWGRQVCGLLAEIGAIDEARKAAGMMSEAAELIASLGAIATELQKADRHEEAQSTLATCREVVEKAPDAESKSELLLTLGDIELALENRKEAVSAYRQALELATRDQNHANQVERLARALKHAGDPDGALEAFRFAQEMALKEISARKTTSGQGYTLSLLAVNVGILSGDLDQADAALDLARRLGPWEQYPIIGSAVSAMVRSGDLERAIKTTAIFAELASASPVSISISTGEASPVNEAGCLALIAEKFAERGDWPRAIEVAEKISSGYERYQAYSRIALRQYAAGRQSDASDLVARQMREVRLQNTLTGKDDGISTAIDFLLDDGHFAEAEEAAASIRTVWMSDSAGRRIADALVKAGDYARAETFATGLSPSNYSSVLVAIAREQATQSGAAVEILDRARHIAHTIQEGGQRSSALREICLAYHELTGQAEAARDVMHEAAVALNQADRFRFRPTPWPDMFLLMARIGEWQTMQKPLKGLVDFDPYDGCVALLKLAEYSWQSSDQGRVDDLMIKAREAAARVTFPPMQSQCYADLAHVYAKMGRFEEAQAKDVIEAGNRASKEAMRYVAEELANLGRMEEAYDAIKSNHSASLNLVDATIRAGNPVRALEYVRTFSESSEKATGLARVASGFDSAGDHAHALALLGEARAQTPGEHYGSLLRDIAERYLAMGERQLAVAMVAGEWQRAPSRWTLIRWLEAAKPLASDAPAFGVDVYRSFRWVEDFLGA